jgi:hypothetical protein
MAANPNEAIARQYDMGAGVNAGLRRYWSAFLRESDILYVADDRDYSVAQARNGFIHGWTGQARTEDDLNQEYNVGYDAGRIARTRYDNEVAPFARGSSNVGYKKSYKIGC